jgi:AcrR family transcriptional regulator
MAALHCDDDDGCLMTTDKQGQLSAQVTSSDSARTRLVAAFDAMLLGREGERGRAGAVAARAGVSRTTFYDHFQSSDDLELVAMRRPLEALADLATGRGDPAVADGWLAHFWDYRSDVRKLLSGRTRARVDRQLEALIRARLPDATGAALFGTQAAAAIISTIDAWVHARIVAKPPQLASQMGVSCAALRAASGFA